MKKNSVKAKIVFLGLVMALGSTQSAFADIKFKDIDETHWAYEYVLRVSDKGLMVGDTTGNFKPNNQIDKFQTAKILARIIGYKYMGLTEAEAQYQEKVYEKNKGLLNLYHKAFTKWNASSDKEIAFLIEKEILAPSDLDKFIIKSESGEEKLRALSREEMAMFLVKATGFKDSALKSTYSFKFSDDENINTDYKPYVYFLKEKGIFTPDEKNNFNPKNGVTRAMMATILVRSELLDGETVQLEESTPLGTPDSNAGTGVVNIYAVDGKVDKYFPALDALQIIKTDGTKAIYKMSANNTIYIDGFLKTTSDLKTGQEVSLVINGNEIVDVKAGTSNPSSPSASTTLSGTILDISINDNKITIEVDLEGGSTDTRDYFVTDTTKITSNGAAKTIGNLRIGDNVKVNSKSGNIQTMDVDRQSLSVTGEILDKKYNAYGTPVLSVAAANGTKYDFTIALDSSITRKGQGEIIWTSLRIGDSVEIKTEGYEIRDLYATGKKATIDGVVENLNISAVSAKITIKDSEGSVTTYNVTDDLANIYSVKVGSKVRLKLDSKEAESITVLSEPASTRANLNGQIISIANGSFRITDQDGTKQDIYINDQTVFFDSIIGKNVDKNSIKNNRRVFVVFNADSSNTAKIITFLS